MPRRKTKKAPQFRSGGRLAQARRAARLRATPSHGAASRSKRHRWCALQGGHDHDSDEEGGYLQIGGVIISRSRMPTRAEQRQAGRGAAAAAAGAARSPAGQPQRQRQQQGSDGQSDSDASQDSSSLDEGLLDYLDNLQVRWTPVAAGRCVCQWPSSCCCWGGGAGCPALADRCLAAPLARNRACRMAATAKGQAMTAAARPTSWLPCSASAQRRWMRLPPGRVGGQQACLPGSPAALSGRLAIALSGRLAIAPQAHALAWHAGSLRQRDGRVNDWRRLALAHEPATTLGAGWQHPRCPSPAGSSDGWSSSSSGRTSPRAAPSYPLLSPEEAAAMLAEDPGCAMLVDASGQPVAALGQLAVRQRYPVAARQPGGSSWLCGSAIQ
jgi:hypothetical protein